MTKWELRLCGDLLVMAANWMKRTDVDLRRLVPDVARRRALMRECRAARGRETLADRGEHFYAAAEDVCGLLGRKLWEEAKE